MYTARRVMRAFARGLWCVLVAPTLPAATPTPAQQQLIQANTFEVVLKKPEKDPVSYEKPLPLDLLPYLERTDAYRSVGTAFALGHNTYVTAAHVLLAAIDSQFGRPALRHSGDLANPAFEIDQIQEFSAYQDFVVFSLRADPAPPGFVVNREPAINDAVMAVGNALGEGVVVRDGLYTSATAEQQDGRWKWIRFSAAASPGNSGGPLLDSQARVIGIVIGKSPSENLNYSLPMSQVMDAPEHKARFDDRTLVSMPFLHGTETYAYKDGFDLPLSWPEFSRRYQQVIEHHEQLARDALLKTYAATLFPRGEGTEAILYAPEANGFRPRLIEQKDDGHWYADAPGYTSTELPGDGVISASNAAGAVLLRLERPDHASDEAFYGDSRAFMDMALKGLNLRRPVGTDLVRVTSLGASLADSVYTDRYGRKWQQRVWPVPFMDLYLECLLLPTPDGYVGVIQYAPSAQRVAAQAHNRLLVDQLDISLSGTLPQWRGYFARRALLPTGFSEVTLDGAPQWQLKTRRFAFSVPPKLMAITDRSLLSLTMGFVPDHDGVAWEPAEAWWNLDEERKQAIGLWRRLKPPKTANQELRTRFNDMRSRHAPFDGSVNRESVNTYSVSTIVDVAGSKPGMAAADLLYGLTMLTDKPGNLGNEGVFFEQLRASAHIAEAGIGVDIVPAQPLAAMTAGNFDALADAALKAAQAGAGDFGRDIRGRLVDEDLQDALASTRKQLAGRGLDADQMNKELLERVQVILGYWRFVPALTHNRDLWSSFLVRNGGPVDTPHRADITALEKALKDSLGDGPTVSSAALIEQLVRAYVDERRQLNFRRPLSEADYRRRSSPCPAPAAHTSGAPQAKTGDLRRTPDEFYPDVSRRESLEGRVILSIKIATSGCAVEFAIAGSSGSSLLDDAAQRFAETMEFFPAESAGKAVDSVKQLAVNFQLRQ